MNKQRTIGFLGAGDVSLMHAEGIHRCPSARLRGVWSIDHEQGLEKAARFDCDYYESAEALVRDPEIDAVFVLTNLESHAQYAELALRHGKHVLIEKPVANTLAELAALKALAEARQLVLMPGHNYIHEESLRRSKDLLERGELGDLAQIYILYNIYHPEVVAERYPGVIRQILTHHAYILLYLAGAPASVSAMKTMVHYEGICKEDIAMVNARLRNGAMAHLSASFAADDHSSDPWTFVVKVLGTKGATRFSYNDWVVNAPAVVHSHTYGVYQYHFIEQTRYFVEECLGKGAPPLSTIDDAILCQQLIEACEVSIAEKREITLASI